MLAIAGVLLVVLGLLAGAALVAADLGIGGLAGGPTLWVLFPLFSLVGYALFIVGARQGTIRGLSGLVSALLLLLALTAAAALVLAAASVVHLPGDTSALWYVLAVAGVLGAVGAAALGRGPTQG